MSLLSQVYVYLLIKIPTSIVIRVLFDHGTILDSKYSDVTRKVYVE